MTEKNNPDKINNNIREKKITSEEIEKELKKRVPDLEKESKENIEKLIKKAIELSPDIYKTKKTKIGEKFLQKAKEDLDASKILYKEKNFANSIYFLQQAIEKLVKAHLLKKEFITQTDLRKIGHKTPLAFIRALKQPLLQQIIKFFEQYINQKIYKDTKPLENLIKKEDKHFVNATYEDLKKILNTTNTTQFKSIFQQIKIIISNLKIKEDQKKKLCKALIMVFDLWILSVITYPHAKYTRYPDNEIKPSGYSSKTAIVRIAPELFDKTEEIINFLKDE